MEGKVFEKILIAETPDNEESGSVDVAKAGGDSATHATSEPKADKGKIRRATIPQLSPIALWRNFDEVMREVETALRVHQLKPVVGEVLVSSGKVVPDIREVIPIGPVHDEYMPMFKLVEVPAGDVSIPADAPPSSPLEKLKQKLKKGPRIYRQTQLAKLFPHLIKGNGTDLNFDGLIVRRILRPNSKMREVPSFLVSLSPDAIRNDMIIVRCGAHRSAMVVRVEDVGELVAEGTIVPVVFEQGRREYFTRDGLRALEGKIVQSWYEGVPTYVALTSLGEICDESTRLVNSSLPTAAKVYMDVKQGQFKDEGERHAKRRAYPLLTASYEALTSLWNQRTDRFFDAARVAAEHGASETVLAAVLLRDVMKVHKDVAGLANDFAAHYREWGIEKNTWEQSIGPAHDIAKKIAQTDAIAKRFVACSTREDAEIWFQAILNMLAVRSETGMSQRDVHLAYFSSVLGKLMQYQPGGLKLHEAKALRTFIAPLAERCGYEDIAACIRNEIFRVEHFEEYSQIELRLRTISRMSYAELSSHLQAMEQLVRDALVRMGIPRSDFCIKRRVKTPFSIWEKLQKYNHKDIKDPSNLWDILGISIVGKDMAARKAALEKDEIARKDMNTAYRIQNVVCQIFEDLPDIDDITLEEIPPLTWAERAHLTFRILNDRTAKQLPRKIEGFLDEEGMFGFLSHRKSCEDFLRKEKDRWKFTYRDALRCPREDRGFSAIMMAKQTSAGKPLEIQITTEDADANNTRGRAAHWVLKATDQLQKQYGISVTTLDEVKDYDAHAKHVVFGELRGTWEETVTRNEFEIVSSKTGSADDLSETLGIDPQEQVYCADLETFQGFDALNSVASVTSSFMPCTIGSLPVAPSMLLVLRVVA